jgi:hypothetical protein
LVLVVGWILAAWIGGFFHHLKIATPEGSSLNLLHYTLILLIVGVPVGLPVVTTTTLAVGAAYLAKEKAIVQKLTAIESLAVSHSASSLSLFPRARGVAWLAGRVWAGSPKMQKICIVTPPLPRFSLVRSIRSTNPTPPMQVTVAKAAQGRACSHLD